MRPPKTGLISAWGLATLMALPSLAIAQQSLSDATVAGLVDALASGGAMARSFTRTRPPDASTNLCKGQSATSRSGVADVAAGPSGRNLEVVPYGGSDAASVNLQVQFVSGSDKLSPAGRALLDKLALALSDPALQNDRFAVAGHTDITGDAAINLELSCARALSARRYLVEKGVATQRLSAYGFGSARLLVADDPASGQNRRVEIRKAP